MRRISGGLALSSGLSTGIRSLGVGSDRRSGVDGVGSDPSLALAFKILQVKKVRRKNLVLISARRGLTSKAKLQEKLAEVN